MFNGAKVLVLPTYDATHYLARARRYARDARHEPDTKLRRLLREAEKRCRRKAQQAEGWPGQMPLPTAGRRTLSSGLAPIRVTTDVQEVQPRSMMRDDLHHQDDKRP